jgi:hypothetical protein
MKYLLAAAATMAMLAGPAYSQMSMGPDKDPLTLKYEKEDKDKAEIEKDYNATMKRLKAQTPTTTKHDPWSSVRPAAESNAKR